MAKGDYDDSESDEEPEVPDSDEDYSAEDEDDSEEDTRARGKKRARSKPAPKAPATRSRGRSSVVYKEDSEEEEDDDDDDSDGSDEISEDSEEYAPKKRGRGAAASSRPTRAAAAKTNKRLKRQVSDPESEEDAEMSYEPEEDEALARQLDRELNGLRARVPRRAAPTPAATSPQPRKSQLRSTLLHGGSGGARDNKGSARSGRTASVKRHSQRSAARGVSYAESEDESSEDGGGGRGGSKRAREPIAAFDGPGDDEVERVLSHRDAEGVSTDPADPWASKEFLIKWMRHSYTHCSWDRRSTLEQLAGFKRVLNYMKKVDNEAVAVARGMYTREELELRDVEKAMEEQLVQQHSQVERILADGEDEEGGSQYLVKWEGLPYSECTWEREEEVLAAVGGAEQMGLWSARIERLRTAPHNSVDAQRKQFKLKSTRALEKQPEFLANGGQLKLRDYQLDGLNWMVYSWSQDRNVILADEMGLGKTVQCVSFLGYLSEVQQIRGPFLVVVPLSTVPNWVREFRRWTPQVNTVVYVGDGRSREVIQKFEFDSPHAREQGRKQFEVLITTYELILKDAAMLSKIKWNYLVVDEAHRLKNAESALYVELASWHIRNKLLVTGTPLQNSLRELWALLHFLEPEKFPDGDDFEREYELQTMDGVSGLHAVLRPHLLRRVIKEVEKSLPPKNERILRVEMTPLQKQYYKWILTRNFRELNKGAKGGGQVSLLNIITELKKVCNHPFLFESAEESFRGSDDKRAAERLVVASGKMVLLDKLLKRLKETGHRVLIFSQMVRVLDIISDYCRLRGWQHQRLDGSTPAAARHTAMEHFNAPDSQDFAFLLSTRAGGLGINLATADTVIIFDSDWNPQNDLQAMSRAHRIGQTETVNIYRFVTSTSVEEDILERAKRKMVLDHLVIQKMDTSGRTVLDPQAAKNSAKAMFGKDELAAILRFGAEDLFKNSAIAAPPGGEGSAEVAAQTHEAASAMYEEDIDAILARAEVVDNRPAEAEGGAGDTGAGGELLSSFNVATFKNEEDDAAFWSRLIPVTERPADEDGLEELGPRAARLKAEDALMDADDRAKRATQRSQGVRRGPPGSDPGPPVEGAALRIEEWRLDVGEDGIPVAPVEGDESQPIITRSLCRRDANAFVRAVRRYGMMSRIEEACSDVGKGMDDLTRPQKLALWLVLMDACSVVPLCRRAVSLTEADNQDPKDAVLDFFGAAVKAQELLQHCTHMRYLARRVAALASHCHQATPPPGAMDAGKKPPAGAAAVGITPEVASRFRLEPGCTLPTPKWGKLIQWTPVDDAMLLLGILLHGIGHWDKIANDPLLHLKDKLSSVVSPQPAGHAPAHAGSSQQGDGEAAAGAGEGEGGEQKEEKGGKVTLPKASHMETRVLSLLKKMYQASKQGQGKGPPPGRQKGPGAAGTRPPPVKVPKPPRHPPKGSSPDTTHANHAGAPAAGSGGAGGGGGGSGGAGGSNLPTPVAATRPSPVPQPAAGASAPAAAGTGQAAEAGAGGSQPGAPAAGFKISSGREHSDRGSRKPPVNSPNLQRRPSSSKPDRDKDKDRDYHRDREGDRHRDRDRDSHRERDRDGLRDREADRDRHRDRDRDRERERERERDRDRERDRHDHRHDRDRDRGRESRADEHGQKRSEADRADRGGGGGRDDARGGAGGGGGSGDVHELLSQVAPQIKTWRELGEDHKLDNKEVAKRMMECLKTIGQHIEEVVTHQLRDDSRSPKGDDLRAKLWKQISRATKNERDGHQLQTLYMKIMARAQQQPAAAAGQ